MKGICMSIACLFFQIYDKHICVDSMLVTYCPIREGGQNGSISS